MHEGVFSCKEFEFVVCSDEWVSSLLSQVGSDSLGKSSVGVKSGTDGSAALGDLVNEDEGLFNALNISLELLDVGGELLAEGEGRGVHQVSPADLDDVCELVSLCGQRADEALERREQLLVYFAHGSDVHH